MRPTDALRHKHELMQWLGTHDGRLFADQMAAVMSRKRPFSDMGRDDEELSVRLRRDLELSETYFVAPHMVDLAEHASRTMPDEVLLPTDLPCDHGFVVLARPMRWSSYDGFDGVSHDALRAAGVTETVHVLGAFTWARGMVSAVARKDGGEVVIRRDYQDGKHLADDHVLIREPGIRVTHYTTKSADDGFAHFAADETAKAAARGSRHVARQATALWQAWPQLTPLYSDQIVFGSAMRGLVFEANDQRLHETGDSAINFLRTLWRLFQQTLASITHERPERSLRRTLARAKLPDTHVTVIDLRRSATRGDGHSDVEWSHRWLVRGHWRNQWYPSEETHRLIYINPFIKGPDGAPLLLRDKVYNLTR